MQCIQLSILASDDRESRCHVYDGCGMREDWQQYQVRIINIFAKCWIFDSYKLCEHWYLINAQIYRTCTRFSVSASGGVLARLLFLGIDYLGPGAPRPWDRTVPSWNCCLREILVFSLCQPCLAAAPSVSLVTCLLVLCSASHCIIAHSVMPALYRCLVAPHDGWMLVNCHKIIVRYLHSVISSKCFVFLLDLKKKSFVSALLAWYLITILIF